MLGGRRIVAEEIVRLERAQTMRGSASDRHIRSAFEAGHRS